MTAHLTLFEKSQQGYHDTISEHGTMTHSGAGALQVGFWLFGKGSSKWKGWVVTEWSDYSWNTLGSGTVERRSGWFWLAEFEDDCWKVVGYPGLATVSTRTEGYARRIEAAAVEIYTSNFAEKMTNWADLNFVLDQVLPASLDRYLDKSELIQTGFAKAGILSGISDDQWDYLGDTASGWQFGADSDGNRMRVIKEFKTWKPDYADTRIVLEGKYKELHQALDFATKLNLEQTRALNTTELLK